MCTKPEREGVNSKQILFLPARALCIPVVMPSCWLGRHWDTKGCPGTLLVLLWQPVRVFMRCLWGLGACGALSIFFQPRSALWTIVVGSFFCFFAGLQTCSWDGVRLLFMDLAMRLLSLKCSPRFVLRCYGDLLTFCWGALRDIGVPLRVARGLHAITVPSHRLESLMPTSTSKNQLAALDF